MSFLRTVLERREFSLEKFEQWMDGGYSLSSTANVTENDALNVPIVWGCIQVKSQDIAKTPLKTYRKLKGDLGREEAPDYPTHDLFRVAANPYTTAYQYRQTMQKDLEVTGNAYSIIQRDRSGDIVALYHRRPHTMCAEVKNGGLEYIYTAPSGRKIPYPAEEVFHLKGLSHDGLTGISPVSVFASGILLAQQQQKHGLKTLESGVRAAFAIKTDPSIGPDKARELAAEFSKAYGGQANAGKIPIFFGGMEPLNLGFSNVDAEFLGSRQFTVEEACRIWRVPPPKVMDFLRATFSNITEVNQSYVGDTMMPIQENWTAEIHLKLMSERDRKEFYVEFDNFDALKGTPKERSEVEVAYTNSGISQIDEVRRSHNWNPVPGGNVNRTQMQNVPLTAVDSLAKGAPKQ